MWQVENDSDNAELYHFIQKIYFALRNRVSYCIYCLFTGESLLAMGWGKTSDSSGSSNVLKQNNFTVVSDDVCRCRFHQPSTSSFCARRSRKVQKRLD